MIEDRLRELIAKTRADAEGIRPENATQSLAYAGVLLFAAEVEQILDGEKVGDVRRWPLAGPRWASGAPAAPRVHHLSLDGGPLGCCGARAGVVPDADEFTQEDGLVTCKGGEG